MKQKANLRVSIYKRMSRSRLVYFRVLKLSYKLQKVEKKKEKGEEI